MNQYYQVNWINGMKINSNHFIDLENHFIGRIQDSASGFINELNYGWIPQQEQAGSSPLFSISLHQNKIKILRGFSALSSGGFLFQVPPNLEVSFTRPSDPEAKSYYLTITARPGTRSAFGKINDQESPLRVPFAIPEFQFDLMPQNEFVIHSLGREVMPIGKFMGPSFDEDRGYLPPCTSIQSSGILTDLCKEVQLAFSDLETKLGELQKRTYNRDSAMLTNLVTFFHLHRTAIDWYLPYQPPIFMMEKIVQFTRIIHRTHEVEYKDNIRKLINRIMEFRYDHLELMRMVDLARSFAKNSSDLLPDAFSIGV